MQVFSQNQRLLPCVAVAPCCTKKKLCSDNCGIICRSCLWEMKNCWANLRLLELLLFGCCGNCRNYCCCGYYCCSDSATLSICWICRSRSNVFNYFLKLLVALAVTLDACWVVCSSHNGADVRFGSATDENSTLF